MSCIPSISERVKAMELLVSYYQEAAGDTANTQEIQNIEREVAMSLTETGSGEVSVTAADAQTLMILSEKYGEKYIFQVVLPLVKKHASNVEFTVTFLSELFSAGETHKFRLEIVQNLFKDTLGDLIPNLQFDHREVRCEQLRNDFAKRIRFDYERYGSQPAEDQSSKPVTADSIATLFHHCEKLGLSDEINKLAQSIVSHAPNANVIMFDHLFLPLLKRLPPAIEPGSLSIGTRGYNEVFRTILSTYISAYVQTPPLKPTGLERQPHGCSLYCEDCVKLNDFLKSPDTLRVKFAVNGLRRNHLVERLSKSCCSTETIKSGTPYKLVVTKTGMEWEYNMKEWKQGCKAAVKVVEDIGLEKLRELLEKGWEEVVGLRAIRAAGGEEGGHRQPLGDLAQGKGTSGMVEKGVGERVSGTTGPEIIDLDCE